MELRGSDPTNSALAWSLHIPSSGLGSRPFALSLWERVGVRCFLSSQAPHPRPLSRRGLLKKSVLAPRHLGTSYWTHFSSYSPVRGRGGVKRGLYVVVRALCALCPKASRCDFLSRLRLVLLWHFVFRSPSNVMHGTAHGSIWFVWRQSSSR